MKRNFSLIATLALVLSSSFNSFGFGRVGHATVAKIAENHLTPAAKANIEKYIDGKSITEVASWMDQVRKQDAYKHTDGWHTAKIAKDGEVKDIKAVAGLNGEIAKLENGAYKNLSDSAVAVGIKLIVHMTGDMHCPSHSKFENHSQSFSFKINGEEYAFHKFFDSGFMGLSRKGWSFNDYAKYLDVLAPEAIKEVQKGSVKDWAVKNASVIEPLYEPLHQGAEFNGLDAENRIAYFSAIAERQMQLAGYRLAGILNDIFDN